MLNYDVISAEVKALSVLMKASMILDHSAAVGIGCSASPVKKDPARQ